ncbi:Cytochrome c biogenesis protein CcmG [Serratia fonticola]|uniref:Cytochrome c biogenesis protein CcmG n=1 Tax=Serratia fonticola TaxID=47917 RepID=A0A4U9VW98_SERFO|nr:Cytochrome c biogenesis protein CcmG [Serratia fonticola]
MQLTRNAGGEDPTMLESALIGKPVPTFKLESLEHPGKTFDQAVLRTGKPILLNVVGDMVPHLSGGARVSEYSGGQRHPRSRAKL